MFGKGLFVLGIVLILSQASLAATDYYATPTGAGNHDGLSWANAFSQSQIDDPNPSINVVDSRMQPGDVLHLGSGTYTLPIHLDSSGTSSSLKRIIGENTGGGLPIIDRGGTGSAIGFGNTASYWSIENLVIQNVVYGIRPDNPSTGSYVGFTLRGLTIRNCRYCVVIYDASQWLIENITATLYTKHGFRLDHNCQDITLRNCTADLSGGDTTLYASAQPLPVGFLVDDPTANDSDFGAGPASSNITFEDCLAQHHRLDGQNPADYWNGDGFVVNQGNNPFFKFVRCRALDNEDGGFDVKPSVTMIDCVAFENKRNFRFHSGTSSMKNCVSGYPQKRGGCCSIVGIWVHDAIVTLDFCTIHGSEGNGVEEDSTGQAMLNNSIISFGGSSGTFWSGNVTLASGTVTYRPGSGEDPQYVNPHPTWDGIGTDMNSNRYGTTKGYFQNPNSIPQNSDHQIVQTQIAPTIDGLVDSIWSTANSQTIANVVVGTVTNDSDLSGIFRTLWDANNFYVLVQVTDDVQQNDSGLETWKDDSVEIYIDANNDKLSSYGSNDYQYRFTWTGSILRIEETKHNAIIGVAASRAVTATGYTVEMKLPWSTLGQSSVAIGALLGLDLHINDDDDGGDRDGKKAWFNTVDTSWQNPSTFATAKLVGPRADHEVIQTATSPVIDGNVEATWNSANSQTIANVVVGTVTNDNDLSGTFRTLWDVNNLYVVVQVTDDVQINDSGTQTWNDDSVEIYIDANNDKLSTYGSNDYQYRFTWTGSSLRIEETKHAAISGVTASRAVTATGYTVEVKLPWSTLGQTSVEVGALLGLDVHINDDDDGGSRDGKKAWFNTVDTSWQNPSTFATAKLVGIRADHEVVQTATAPSIDGNVEAAWNSANSQTIGNVVAGAVTDDNDLSGSFRTLWDANGLYVLVQVTDDAQQNDSGLETWKDDSVEIYIDANNDKLSSYGSNDYQYRFTWTGTLLRIEETKHNAIVGVTASRAVTANGYVVEVKLPWTTLGQSSVEVGALLGLDVHINDDDDGGDRDGKKAWFNTVDTSWLNPSTFASAKLVGVR